MFGKGKQKLIDKKSGRPKGSTPWNKGTKYRVVKGRPFMKYKKLSRDEDGTIIQAGHVSFTPQQLEEEIKAGSDIGKKLKAAEKYLEKYY